MLTARFAAGLADHLLPREQYQPYPPAADRAGWEALSTSVRSALIAGGEAQLGDEWPSLPATTFMEFRRNGNRSRFEGRHFPRRYRLASLVLAECAEGQGRFLDDLIDGLWAVCEESYWGVSAHNWVGRWADAPLPDTTERQIDLFAAETGGLLAFTLHLLGPELAAIHPVIPDRVQRELTERILLPYETRDDFGWMGLLSDAPPNNWNPWCASNCLTAVLLAEPDAARRLAAVEKTLRILDRFLAGYHADGGCDEGPGYWQRAGASLFDCLELLRGATGGWIDLYDDSLVGHIGRYLYRVFIADDWYVNFADAGARLAAEGPLVRRYGRRIGDARLEALGEQAIGNRAAGGIQPKRGESLLRSLPTLFEATSPSTGDLPTPFEPQAWLDGIQVMTAREQTDSAAGLYLAVKGGHNAESHNHNDVGSFVVALDGRPVLLDLGVETYTAKTFSPQRYEIWTMQSAWHNLPTIGGVQQQAGRQFAARDAVCTLGDDSATLTLELADAWPAETGIETWVRTASLHRAPAAAVTIQDRFTLAAPQSVELSLVLADEPTLRGAGLTTAGERAITITWPASLAARVERTAVADERLQPVWGDAVWRVLLGPAEPVGEGDWAVRISR